jgi:hypothetical protein
MSYISTSKFYPLLSLLDVKEEISATEVDVLHFFAISKFFFRCCVFCVRRRTWTMPNQSIKYKACLWPTPLCHLGRTW